MGLLYALLLFVSLCATQILNNRLCGFLENITPDAEVEDADITTEDEGAVSCC